MNAVLYIIPAAVILLVILIFFLQSRIKIGSYEEFFSIRRSDPVFVKYLAEDQVVIRWVEDLHPQKISLLSSPGSAAVSQSWVPDPQENSLVVQVSSEPIRPFFRLEFKDRNPLTVSTRVQPFDHIRNFRDMGGYVVEDGRQIAWGKLYRSGHIGRPTDADLKRLQALGIKTIIDLRDEDEIARLPDKFPENIQHKHVFITNSVMVRRASVMLRRQRLAGEFTESYKNRILEQGARGIGEVIRMLSNPENLPAVFHCTAGKDRAGVVSALILLTLGVPPETVIADYTLSNLFAETYIHEIERRIRKVRWIGMRKEHFFPMAAARPLVMESALAYLHSHYGTAEAYLSERAEVPREDLKRLKEIMLS